MAFAQLTARLKNFLRDWLLVLGLKEGLVECATVCVKSVVILAKPNNVPFNHQNHNITNMKSYANIIFVCAAIYVFSFILQRR